MAFTFKGENPSLSLYQELGSIGFFEDVEWKVFHRPGQNKINLLLVAQGSAKRKANYRNLVWDGVKLFPSRDATILKEHRGDMHQSLLNLLAGIAPADSDLLTAIPGRKREGTVPEGEEWSKVGEVLCDELSTWSIYRKNVDYEAVWVTLKLVADLPVPNKANYYLKWNGERLAGCKESTLLAEHRPYLCDTLIEKLKELKVIGNPTTQQEEQAVKYTDLGPVGEVVGSPRNLMVVDDLSNTSAVEVWLSTSTPNVVTAISFRAEQQADGSISCEGPLYNSLKRTPLVLITVEELLKQYFLEKELYAGIDNG